MIKDRLRLEIESVMKGPSRQSSFSMATLLLAISKGYASAIRIRNRLYQKGSLRSFRLPCMVISVGNITVGGTGKTPFTIFVARLLQADGVRTTIISRGYGGKAENIGGIVSNGHEVLMGPEDAGDEPYMLAMKLPGIPVVVGKKRSISGQLAFRRFHPQIILLDDGFQHMALKRDLDIVLLDHGTPLGNGKVLPRGVLREPPEGLKRAGILVMTRSGGGENRLKEIPACLVGVMEAVPVFFSDYETELFSSGSQADIYRNTDSPTASKMGKNVLKEKKAFVFTGIANNASFIDTVQGLGCSVEGTVEFPDHHRYNSKDLDIIYHRFKDSGADFMVTTEKDYVKICSDVTWGNKLVVVGVRVKLFSQKKRFEKVLSRFICEAAESKVKHQTGRQEQ